MSGSELVTTDPPDLALTWKLSQRLCKTEFVPRSLQGRPEAVMAAILTGAELGIGPMQSLRSIDVIQGKPTLNAELMRALVLRAGHRIDFIEHSEIRCTLTGVRGDSGDSATVEWSMDDATRAGLLKKGGGWLTYPRAMLVARATSELCRLLFPDVVLGAGYIAEELGGPDPEPPTTDSHLAAPGEITGASDDISDAEIVTEGGGPDDPELHPRLGECPVAAGEITDDGANKPPGLVSVASPPPGDVDLPVMADLPLPPGGEVVPPPRRGRATTPKTQDEPGVADTERFVLQRRLCTLASKCGGDDTRHAVAHILSKGRTKSSKELDIPEAGRCVSVLKALIDGVLVLDGDTLTIPDGAKPVQMNRATALLDACGLPF